MLVRVHDVLLQGKTRIEEEPIHRYEKVNICIYRAYALRNEEEISIVGNANIEAEEAVII